MLQRDYFIRLIQEFMAALSLFLEKKKEEKDEALRELYRQYVGDYDIVRNLSVDELLDYAKDQWSNDERIERISMTAELLYAEASYKSAPLRQLLMDKAYRLFDYVETNGTTFSIDRRKKMAEIERMTVN